MSSNRRTRRLNKPHFVIMKEGYIRVPLTRGEWADIDFCDLRRVIKHSWCLRKYGGKGKTTYGEANIKTDGKWKRVLLHRFLLQPPPEVFIDHKDRNGLNCRRDNLRMTTRNGNQHNTGPHCDSRSKYKGVSWHTKGQKWVAQITVNRQHQHLGLHDTEELAAKAYDAAARRLHGEFAYQNFPEERKVA